MTQGMPRTRWVALGGRRREDEACFAELAQRIGQANDIDKDGVGVLRQAK